MTQKCAGYIQLTFIDELNNGFVTLGGVGLLTDEELKRYWDDVPTFCGKTVFIADLMDSEHNIVADRMISSETCEAYLKKPIDVLIAEGRAKTCFTFGDLKKQVAQQHSAKS